MILFIILLQSFIFNERYIALDSMNFRASEYKWAVENQNKYNKYNDSIFDVRKIRTESLKYSATDFWAINLDFLKFNSPRYYPDKIYSNSFLGYIRLDNINSGYLFAIKTLENCIEIKLIVSDKKVVKSVISFSYENLKYHHCNNSNIDYLVTKRISKNTFCSYQKRTYQDLYLNEKQFIDTVYFCINNNGYINVLKKNYSYKSR